MTVEPFPTLFRLEQECSTKWPGYRKCIENTLKAEEILKSYLIKEVGSTRILGPSSSLVLCGSFARFEMVGDSDCDWSLLLDGPASNSHSKEAEAVRRALQTAHAAKQIRAPGSSGTFGNLTFSHDLVHRIGGGADSNENLTRRILMLLESRPVRFSEGDHSFEVWTRVLRCILQRYFEEDVHFSPGGEKKVPRFLVNDLTRFWRTMGVDDASKYRDQGGNKWAIRNAKLRLSRKLLFASGLAFCFRCQLDPPERWEESLFGKERDRTAEPFIDDGTVFARTTPLEVLAQFVDKVVTDPSKRVEISSKIFGAYHDWLCLLDDAEKRDCLEKLTHSDAPGNTVFAEVREIGKQFASGLKLLFFGKEKDDDNPISNLSLEYVGF